MQAAEADNYSAHNGSDSDDEIGLENYAAFASAVIADAPAASKKRRRKAEKQSSALEEVEEQRRTAFTPGWEESLTTHAALPIKADGKVIERKVVREVKKKEADEDEEAEAEEQTKAAAAAQEDAATVSAHRQFFGRLMRLDVDSARKFIAMTCEDIVAAPEKSFRAVVQDDGQKVPSKVDQLLQMLDHTDSHVRELAMLSATMVFKDICPGYRIRLPTEKELQQRVKKETKRLRDYERRLLMSYQRLLKKLNSVVNSELGNPTRKSNLKTTHAKLGASALRCMCELLRALPHFNFRSNLLETIVKRAAQPNPHITTLCTQMFTELFRRDQDGELSFETARKIAQVLKARDFEVPEELVTCLHHIKLNVHEDKAHQIRKAAKQQRKRKGKDEVDEALKEAEATTDTLERDRMQANTLHELTIIYLRVLKSPIGFKLMPAVLEGLSKIAHLINIDTIQDLMEVLRQMLRDTEDRIPFPVALQCIRTALCTLQGPGRELAADETEFISRLYGLMAELPTKPSLTPVVFECIENCFIKKREVSPPRVAAFCKRLCSIAAHLPQPYNEACLALAQILITRYSRLQTLLETEDECVAAGSANLHTDDADNCNALGTIAWELPLYMRHVSSALSHAAARVARMDPLKPTEMPGAVVRNFDDVKVYIQAFNGLEGKQFKRPSNKQQNKRRRTNASWTSGIAAEVSSPTGKFSAMYSLSHTPSV